MTTVVAVLIAALTFLCLSDLAHAALPTGETTECVSRFCDEQSGCGTTAIKPAPLPVATLVTPVVVIPAATTLQSRAAEPQAVRDRQVLPLAPRSPPVL